jgi:hypothetical protein
MTWVTAHAMYSVAIVGHIDATLVQRGTVSIALLDYISFD